MSRHEAAVANKLVTLALLRWYVRTRNHAPTQWELANLRGMTDVGVAKHLRWLKAHGFVGLKPRQWRGMWVTEKGWNAGVQVISARDRGAV